jgi:hypothetical protein
VVTSTVERLLDPLRSFACVENEDGVDPEKSGSIFGKRVIYHRGHSA